MARAPVIAHLSDLHFGTSFVGLGHRAAAINEAAKVALKGTILQAEPRPDFIVVTGDIANRGNPAEMREARSYLESILQGLLEAGHPARCIVVPGNHDAWRTTWAYPLGPFGSRDRLTEWNSVFPLWSFLPPQAAQDKCQDVTPLSLVDFYTDCLSVKGNKSSKSQRREIAKQRAQKALEVCEFFPHFNLAVIKLDSNVSPHRRPSHIAKGRVGSAQQGIVNEILNDYLNATKDSNTPFEEAQRVALVHHHLTRLPNVKFENWMMMEDAGEVALWLAGLGVRLVLHGHFHFADVVGLTYWTTGSASEKIDTVIISGGSATARDIDDGQNSYYSISLGNFRSNINRRIVFPKPEVTRFQFVHRPNLQLHEASRQDIPIFLEALEALVMAEEKYADQRHTYSLIKSQGFIDRDRSYWGALKLCGTNMTSQDSESVPFTFVAIGAQYFEDCLCQARDLIDGAALTVKLMEHRPISVFPCQIYKHLGPNESFSILVTFRLSSVMLKEWDYDMLSLLGYARDVQRAEFSLVSEAELSGPSLWELRGERLKRSKLILNPIRRQIEIGGVVREAGGYEVSIPSPTALAYLLPYEQLS